MVFFGRAGHSCLFAMLSKYSLLSLVIPLTFAVRLPINDESPSTKRSVDSSHIQLKSSSVGLGALTPLNLSSLKEHDDCFDAATDPRLKPAQMDDCFNAAQQFSGSGSLTRPLVLTRRRIKGIFPLPQVFRHRTCVISVDVVHDGDEDKFPLQVVQQGALDLSTECVEGSTHVGGKKFVGPKKLVYVLVFGRDPPSMSTGGGLVQAASNVTNNAILELT